MTIVDSMMYVQVEVNVLSEQVIIVLTCYVKNTVYKFCRVTWSLRKVLNCVLREKGN